ncbi:MAG: hypothetical protein ACU85E_14675 [Gammaproteobacteria bacterium]
MTKKSTAVSDMENNDLEKQALTLLNASKYREAIELYKKLLKVSDNGEWRRRLAFCYLQRAMSFADKGMHKEALVLWENFREHAQPPYECYDHYLVWLIQSKQPARIQSALQQLTAQQLDKDYPKLAAVLGLLILTEHPEFQLALPQDAVFIAHLKIAQTALQAFRANDLDGMDEALKQLPYRSAFRDLRTLLKACSAVSDSLKETRSLLSKIPAYSPYSQTARLVLACTVTGSALLYEMLTFNRQQRKLIAEIIGLNTMQFELIESLGKQKQPFSDKMKFNLAMRFRSLCSTDLPQRFCFATLTTYPAGRKDYGKAFGTIDEFEANRLKALACEREGNDYDAGYYWQQCVNALTKNGTGDGLKIALILRHIGEKLPVSEQIPLLIESLDYDPSDKECFLEVLNHYRQDSDSSDSYKQWLNKALDQFPQDLDILTLAAQAATRDKAFKKAIQYASKILHIDPLNSFAKQVIFSSHLAHARQLLKAKKYHLVETEIEQAQALKLGKNYSLQTQLLKNLLRFASGDKKQGLQAISEALNQLNQDPVTAHFQAAVEALLTGLPVATLLRELPPAKDHLLSAQELSRLNQLITRYSQEDINLELLHKALEKIKAPLKQSVLQQNFDENLLLTLCQTLDTIHHFELLRHCAKWAQAKWHKPIWMYYRIYSDTNDDPIRCTFMNAFRLQENLDQARREKDLRAVALIGRYLDRYHEAHPSRGTGFIENLFDMDELEDSADPLDELFGHLSDEVFIKLDKKLAALVKKTSPEKLIQELNKISSNKSKLLLAMMQDPDLFTSLMIIKAAEELGLAIGVTYEDVLQCFDIGKQPSSFPFPF